MDLRIFKALGRTTASLEFWDRDCLLAEVFACDDGVRRLHLSNEAASRGLDWDVFSQLVPEACKLLDQADEEMREVRHGLGEG